MSYQKLSAPCLDPALPWGTCGHPEVLGTVDPWAYPWAHTLDSGEVYVLRVALANVRMREPADALAFVRAIGQDQNLHLDVRGVAVWKADGMGERESMLDLVLTSAIYFSPPMIGSDNGEAMAKNLEADPDLQRLFPGLTVRAPIFGELTAPAEAIDHWRAQPILWDHALPGPRDRGGPTDTFAAPAEYSVVLGQADDGKRSKPWRLPPAEIGGGAGKPVAQGALLWILGLGAILAVAALAQGKEKGR